MSDDVLFNKLVKKIKQELIGQVKDGAFQYAIHWNDEADGGLSEYERLAEYFNQQPNMYASEYSRYHESNDRLIITLDVYLYPDFLQPKTFLDKLFTLLFGCKKSKNKEVFEVDHEFVTAVELAEKEKDAEKGKYLHEAKLEQIAICDKNFDDYFNRIKRSLEHVPSTTLISYDIKEEILYRKLEFYFSHQSGVVANFTWRGTNDDCVFGSDSDYGFWVSRPYELKLTVSIQT